MHVLRRAVLRASAVPKSPFSCGPRCLTTASFNHLRIQPQIQLSRFQKRCASSEAAESANEVEAEEGAPAEENSSTSESVLDTLGEKAQEVNETIQTNVFGRQRPQGKPGKVLYVGNLYFGVTEDDLKQEFERCGEVESLRLIKDIRGLSKGFGYVTFKNEADAEHARENLANTTFEGRRLTVDWAAEATPRGIERARNPPSKTIFIGNMSYEMSDRDLHALFREIKNCNDVRVAVDRRTGQPRGFAHADFTDIESARAAFEALSNKVFYGRALKLDYGVQRSDTPPQRPE